MADKTDKLNTAPEWNSGAIFGLIAGIWFLLNAICIVVFFWTVDVWYLPFTTAVANMFRRLVGYGRNYPLTTGYKKIKEIEEKLDSVETKVIKMTKPETQKGGSRTRKSILHTIRLPLYYFNICIILFTIIFLTLFPSFLKQDNILVGGTIKGTPAFTVT